MSEGMKADEAEIETRRLQHDLDITNADHIALWLEANTILDEPMNQCISWLACRIVEAHEAARAPAPLSSPHVDALRKLVPFLEAHHVDASAVVNAADAIQQMQRRVEAMREALALAVPIIEEERRAVIDCHTVLYRGSTDYGKVVDPEAVEWIEAADKALETARAALGDGAV